MRKYCTKCGQPFDAVGREVICPSCKAQATEDAKHAAVLKAKRASWTGESVPVRISGRASTVIREYGAANNLPFAAALDALLKSTPFFQTTGKAWDDITPYKSHRRDRHATQETPQETASKPQDVKQDVPQDVKQDAPQDVKQVMEFGGFGVVINGETAKATSTAKASKPSASKAKASKASASKAAK